MRTSRVRIWLGRLFREWTIETWRPISPASAKPGPSKWSDAQVTLAWIGHSTVLINFFGVIILTDPVLFPRIGIRLPGFTIGPKRLTAPALSFDELPKIDLVLLSHAHFDHLDLRTLRCFDEFTSVITARATSDLLKRTRFSEVSELDWGKSKTYCAAAPTLGGDQLDAAVLLSGAYDFHDPASLVDTRCGKTFGDDVRNYVGCSPGPACDGNGGLLDLASPYRRFTSASSPVFIIATNLDHMPPNQFTILVNRVAAVGVPDCEQLLITEAPGPDGCTRHSFQIWPSVAYEAITFLNTSFQDPAAIAPGAQ